MIEGHASMVYIITKIKRNYQLDSIFFDIIILLSIDFPLSGPYFWNKGDEHMNRIGKNVISGILGLALFMAFSFPSLAADVPRITKEELKGMLGKENVVIIDVRSDLDREKSNQKIQGAVIEDVGKVETWMAKYPKDKTFVFYCS
jgi:hypothetical protein